MASVLTTSHNDTKKVVLAPIFVLSAVFLTAIGVSWANRMFAFTEPDTVLAGSLAVFAGAVATLAYAGFRHIHALEQIGLRDSLTNLPNRRALHVDIQRAYDDGLDVALAMLDLDGFKLVNDHYGHQVGDAAIKECGEILRMSADGEASVYRLGGDEYALLVCGPLAANLLEGLSRRIIERLSKPVKVDDRRLTLGVSIGLARSSTEELLPSSELLRRADVSMYAAKSGGKMRCTWFTLAFDKSREQIKLMDEELRIALANDEFRLVYQPLVDSHTRNVVAVESLLRWERPDGKRVGPDTFIPVAEESGFINAIGLWVLRQACSDALAWDGISLSVNISAAQLRNPEFPIQLGHILEETGFDPARLELEITETCLVIDPLVAERSLAVIRGFGVRVALDDFGTGYASIGFLRQFRFEKLKLDRSLVVQAGEDDSSRAMMLSSITVARAMNMDVTAEGVETQAQADMVRAAGCDTIQGWLYFKAMPACEIGQYLGGPMETEIDRARIEGKAA